MNVPSWLRDYPLIEFPGCDRSEAAYLCMCMGDKGLEFVNLFDETISEALFAQLAAYLAEYMAQRSIWGS